MASASTHITHTGTTRTGTTRTGVDRGVGRSAQGVFAIPGLLRCLVVSWSDQRAQLLQSVAEDESWQAKVGSDVQEFLRSVFQLEVPLTIVDLPPRGSASYPELREMATQTCRVKRSLLVVCGAADDSDEEIWARQLGAWAYLPGASDLSGLRLVFAEARKSLAKRSTAVVEARHVKADGNW